MVDYWVLGSNHIKFCRFYSPFLFTFHILLIRWATSQVFLFDHSITKNKLKLNKLPKITIVIWGWCASPLAHLYRWKGENFGQKIWDKVRRYWEHPWKTHWELGEHHGNNLRTWWELKNWNFSSSHTSFPKGKKMNPLGCMYSCFIGCMHVIFLNMAITSSRKSSCTRELLHLLKRKIFQKLFIIIPQFIAH
jgi:hypothetical protein